MDRAELLRFELARTRSFSGALRAVEERICRGAGKALPPVSLAVSDVADAQASVEFTVLRSASLFYYSQAIKFSAGTTFVPTTYGVEAVRAWIRDHGLLCAPVDVVRDSSAADHVAHTHEAEGAIPSPATEITNEPHPVATEPQAAADGAQEPTHATGAAVGGPVPPEEIEIEGSTWRRLHGLATKGSRKICGVMYAPVEVAC